MVEAAGELPASKAVVEPKEQAFRASKDSKTDAPPEAKENAAKDKSVVEPSAPED